MARDIVIYMEGEEPLREGLSKLFYPYLEGRSPFQLLGGKTDAIKKFNNDTRNQFKYLLIDLDRNDTGKKEDEKEFGYQNKENVLYMIQETEAWFISQPTVLENYFGFDVCSELNKKYTFGHTKDLSNPKSKLKELLKVKGKTYKENRDGVQLMKKLQLSELRKNFEDVESLIKVLEQK